MKLLVLAAGSSSRFGKLKQYTEVDSKGNFIIDYSLSDAINLGIKDVVFVIREQHEEIFKNTIYKKYKDVLNINYVFQSVPEGRTKPLGTGEAILAASKYLNDSFIVINADDYYGKKALELAKDYLLSKNDDISANVTYYLNKTLNSSGEVSRAICKVENNFITSFDEVRVLKKDNTITAHEIDKEETFNLTGNELISMDLFCFKENVINLLKEKFDNTNFGKTNEFILPVVINELVKENKMKIIPIINDEQCVGITFEEDLKLFKNAIK